MQNGDASQFNQGFIKRTATARVAAGFTQQDIAGLLGVDQGTYKQYETRTPLPHRYIPAFCLATRKELEWLFEGRTKGKKRQLREGAPQREARS